MEPKLVKGSYAFVELNAPLNNREIGIIEYNDNTFSNIKIEKEEVN